MSDVVIRPARQDERALLEVLQWRSSLANPGDHRAPREGQSQFQAEFVGEHVERLCSELNGWTPF
jgi:hypothetical protein